MNEDIRDESIIKVSPSGVIRAYKSPMGLNGESKIKLMNRNAAVSNPNFKEMDESILQPNNSTNFKIAPDSNRHTPMNQITLLNQASSQNILNSARSIGRNEAVRVNQSNISNSKDFLKKVEQLNQDSLNGAKVQPNMMRITMLKN